MTAVAARLRQRVHLPSVRRPSVTVIVLTVVVIALAVATGLLFSRWLTAQATTSARTDSATAAQQKVPALLSYSYQTFTADLAKAKADCTPQFATTYGNLMDSQVKQTAMQQHVDTQAQVSATSVVSASPGNATLLVFVNEQTKTDAKAESVLNDTAVKVTMTKVNGTWLISNLVPQS